MFEARWISAALTLAGAGLLAARPRPPLARVAWAALLLAAVANAVVLSLLPHNLVNTNIVHHYLGAKYAIPYGSFYRLVNAAIERPQVSMRDLDRPPAMLRDDPREERAYFIDLMRARGVAFDPLAPLAALRARAEASGAVREEAERILREHLPEERIAAFREDVRRAITDERFGISVQTPDRDITEDYGFNGSPLYAFVRRLDPTLHVPFGPGTARLNLAWQVLAGLLLVWGVGAALGADLGTRLAMAALLFASWDFAGWALPGLVFAGVWLPVAVALLAMRRGWAAAAGAAVAWAGLIKIFPFVLLLPGAVGLAGGRGRGRSEGVSGGSAPWSARFLAGCVAGVLLLGGVSVASGRSWAEFLRKIVAEFQSGSYLMNSVSLSQGLFTLGIHGSPLGAVLSLATAAFLATMFLGSDETPPFASLPRRCLVLLGMTGWLVQTWFNYYGVAPLLLLPLAARRARGGAAAAAAAMALAFVLPEFDDPRLLELPVVHALKVAPYLLVPAWLFGLELRAAERRRTVRRAAVIAVALAAAATGGEALRHAAIRRLDATGGALLDRGDAAGALRRFEAVARLAPSDPYAHTSAAIALARLGRSEEAGRRFARAVALAPESAETRSNYGRWLLGTGRTEDAQEELEAARRLAPHDETILCDLARVRLARGEISEAVALVNRARELAPGSAAVARLLARLEGESPDAGR